MDVAELTRNIMMFFILPLWLMAGFADYLCHRAADIESTSGPKESVLHLAQFGEMAVPILAALFLDINSLVILVMIVCFLLHEVTALWDVSYAVSTREVTPIEQHVHSFLEMLPLMGLVMVVVLHWDQFIALFGLASPRFDITLKQPPLPWAYTTIMLALVLLFEVLPYLEELARGLRQKQRTVGGG
ncbi:diguanylate cyclase [Xanthobacteraceae bacterium Astr-EGSB]|uniref:diguanylate cyclase n=1 Tax=Astrobacterium formosum TaxID=3069710 RepID=UPI0027AE2832|nr:diguanylate cyclase [Xanthobacteraceae bacterium Astr-EGSB]